MGGITSRSLRCLKVHVRWGPVLNITFVIKIAGKSVQLDLLSSFVYLGDESTPPNNSGSEDVTYCLRESVLCLFDTGSQ